MIVEAFVAQGARVHLCDVNHEALAEMAALSPSIVAEHVDLADADALDAWLLAAIADRVWRQISARPAPSGPKIVIE